MQPLKRLTLFLISLLRNEALQGLKIVKKSHCSVHKIRSHDDIQLDIARGTLKIACTGVNKLF